ncbi:MAG: hypothetical protein JWN78_2561 [Bacteroidota bacterium]|nr:hypothetical protein [Bacteroidota bacterium]
MKTFLFIIFTISLKLLSANAGPWFPVGAEWYYGVVYCCSGGEDCESGRVVKDTIINTKTCKVIESYYKRAPDEIYGVRRDIYQEENNKVSKIVDGNYLTRYDFSKNAGDTFWIALDSGKYACDSFMCVIDSISISIIHPSLTSQYCRLIKNINCDLPSLDYSFVFTEKIMEPFLEDIHNFYHTDGPDYSFRCYKDDSLNIQLTAKCDSVYAEPDNSLFAPIGAKWYNSIWCMEPQPLYYCGYYTLEIKRDTMIAGRSCRVGEYNLYTIDSVEHAERIPDADMYFYMEDHKVYYYANDSFLQLYDFSLHVDDTMITQMSSKCNYYSQAVSGITGNTILTAKSVVDSIKPFFGNFQTRKAMVCHAVNLGSDSGFIGGEPLIVEKLGVVNSFSLFGQITNSGLITAGTYGALRCYEDHQMQYKNPNFNAACNALNSSHVGLINKKSETINIYPNPSNNKLFFDGKKDLNQYRLEIYQTSGMQTYINGDKIKNNTIDISELLPGIYFGTMANGTEVYNFRFVKGNQ